MVEWGLQDVTGYSSLTDEQLDNIVTQFMYFNIQILLSLVLIII